MELIYSKDDTAPDAVEATEWLQNHLGVKDLYFDAICQSQVSFQIHEGDGDNRIFEHKGVFYVLQSSCGKYEELFTATAAEINQLLNQYRNTLTKPPAATVKHRAVRSFVAQYFKPSGKFYTEGEFDLEVTVLAGGTVYMQDVVDHLRAQQEASRLPGLASGKEFTIYVTHEDGFPCLIPPLT